MNLLVNIDVDDLHRAIEFYTSAFDLTVARRFGLDGAELLGGSAPIYLLLKAAGSQASFASGQVRNYERHWTPVHLDIVVKDVEASVERALSAGARLENEIRLATGESWLLWPIRLGMGFVLYSLSAKGTTK
jgi:predicted enzyme related to lactoylglutathione lyase